MSNGFLIDTNIISLFSPDRKQAPSDPAKAWFRDNGELLYLSVITVAEIERGLRRLHRRGSIERSQRLSTWLDSITETFGEHLLPIDPIVARIAGGLDDFATASGANPGFADVLIAATAQAYDLTVVTANLKHLGPLGVACDLPEALRT
ncbi:PIN domain-containing protein [Rhizobium rosettiformans]|uniref:PIN domain-containing protein n=1 Tax=Rhizobium rosettiformans TaxID=1368430 RepID=UPI00285CF21B|nr:PIN domain-containing protein [Rhizobium rosettiformans]MDR7027374.1 putative nucleic acid-binding protein [Rhizobium rosettiformans]MDR7065495.1 putative nucleic acid-binding protein [Rhizobium rosettiformans]